MSDEKFWSRVDRSGEHWLWTGASQDGYGGLKWEGKTQSAHRVAYMLAFGAIPEGAMVLHSCDIGLCCRPEHLFLGDAGTNARDCAAKGRNTSTVHLKGRHKTMCCNGHSLSGDNLYIQPDGKHACKTCRRENTRRWRNR